MDPTTASLLASFATQTVLEVMAIYENKALTEEEQKIRVAEILINIKENAGRSYKDYDPNLDADIAASGLDDED